MEETLKFSPSFVIYNYNTHLNISDYGFEN